MPPPPRKLVLPLPVGSQANPKRGAKFFLSGKLVPVGAPLSPGNTNPGARREIVSTVVRESLRRFALGVGLGCVVFVAQSESQDQVLAQVPLVLAKYISAFAANGGRRIRVLEICVGGAE